MKEEESHDVGTRGIMLNGFLISRLVTLITVCCLNLLHVEHKSFPLIHEEAGGGVDEEKD
jgi:hypothetical protein